MIASELMEAGRELSRVLVRMAMVSEGRAVDPSATPITTGKSDGNPPPGAFSRDRPLAEEWLAMSRRFIAAAERDCQRARRGERPSSRVDKARDRRVAREYPGREANEVAFIEDVTPRYVEQHRGLAGLNPRTGLPERRNTITEPALDTLRREGDQ